LLEGDPHQPRALRRLERAKRRAQANIDRDHATDPDDGAKYVHSEATAVMSGDHELEFNGDAA